MNFLEYVNDRTLDKKKLEKIGDYVVYVVRGAAVRRASLGGDEFNHFSTHWEMPKLIPPNKIWLSDEVSIHERPFLIHNGLRQYLAHAQGDKNWYQTALRTEKAEREKVDGIRLHSRKTPPTELYKNRYGQIGDCTVWLVDGELVRDLYKTDFILGGNPVYNWLPKNEIWIEQDLAPKEIPFVLLHEFVEYVLMQVKRLSYAQAHPLASKVEFHARQGKRWTKTDALTLTPERALAMVKPYLGKR